MPVFRTMTLKTNNLVSFLIQVWHHLQMPVGDIGTRDGLAVLPGKASTLLIDDLIPAQEN